MTQQEVVVVVKIIWLIERKEDWIQLSIHLFNDPPSSRTLICLRKQANYRGVNQLRGGDLIKINIRHLHIII